MGLVNIMLTERSQKQKATSCMTQLHEMSIGDNSVETESKLVVARGWGQGDSGEWLHNGCGVFFWGEENHLELHRGRNCTMLWMYWMLMFTVKWLVLCYAKFTLIKKKSVREMLKILRNKVSIIVLLAHIQCYRGREAERTINRNDTEVHRWKFEEA